MNLTKILPFVASMLLIPFIFSSCEEKVEPNSDDGGQITPPAEEVDEISIDPEQKTFAKEGGVQQVMVTSTGEWTLKLDETSEKERAGEWITVKDGVQSGKDGDIVTFEVKENYTGKQLTAVYVFTCGKAETKFTAVSESGEVNFMTLQSEANVDLKYNAKETTIALSTNINYRAVQVEVSEAAKEWCELNFAQEGGDNLVNLIFKLKENFGKEVQEAVITITGERVEPLTVTLSQRAKTELFVDKQDFVFAPEGGQYEINITSNVEYKVEVIEGADWINHAQKTPGVETISAGKFDGKRNGKLTISEANPYPGDEPVVVEVKVSQAPASLVSAAIDMNDFRLRPYWREGTMGAKFENCTVELLIRAEDLSKEISTVFGIEGYWLLRFGDTNVDPNHLHLAGNQVKCNYDASRDDYWPGTGQASGRIINDKMKLDPNKWYHIAVTLERDSTRPSSGWFFYNSIVRIFIDGVEVHSGATSDNPFDFAFVRREDGEHPFYFGYSWTKGREFNGKMAEIRIWNRALKADELQAENHFYTVDPQTEGLVAYWKCNRSEVKKIDYVYDYTCIPDETGHGYHLVCEGYQNYDWEKGAEPKIVPITLPE